MNLYATELLIRDRACALRRRAEAERLARAARNRPPRAQSRPHLPLRALAKGARCALVKGSRRLIGRAGPSTGRTPA